MGYSQGLVTKKIAYLCTSLFVIFHLYHYCTPDNKLIFISYYYPIKSRLSQSSHQVSLIIDSDLFLRKCAFLHKQTSWLGHNSATKFTIQSELS